MTRPTSFDRDQLLACARGELFGSGNARLPSPPMLMFDRITHVGEHDGAFGKGCAHSISTPTCTRSAPSRTSC